ncbi:MAG: hypothetical protein WBP85_00260 [Terracidiphilus sp.]
MNESADSNETEEQSELEQQPAVRPRTAGAPLSEGVSRPGAQSPAEESRQRFVSHQPARVPEGESAKAPEFPGVQRAAGILRSALPLLQRLLPLLDGNFATVVGNLLASRANAQAARSSSKLDLSPIEDGLAELRSQQHGLRLEVAEQNIALKAVEDQLELVREATSRNVLEQQETLEDLKALGNRIKTIAVIALLLAAASLATTVALFLRMNKMLP